MSHEITAEAFINTRAPCYTAVLTVVITAVFSFALSPWISLKKVTKLWYLKAYLKHEKQRTGRKTLFHRVLRSGSLKTLKPSSLKPDDSTERRLCWWTDWMCHADPLLVQDFMCKSNTLTSTGYSACILLMYFQAHITLSTSGKARETSLSPRFFSIWNLPQVSWEEKGHGLRVKPVVIRYYCNRRHLSNHCGYIWCRTKRAYYLQGYFSVHKMNSEQHEIRTVKNKSSKTCLSVRDLVSS